MGGFIPTKLSDLLENVLVDELYRQADMFVEKVDETETVIPNVYAVDTHRLDLRELAIELEKALTSQVGQKLLRCLDE